MTNNSSEIGRLGVSEVELAKMEFDSVSSPRFHSPTGAHTSWRGFALVLQGDRSSKANCDQTRPDNLHQTCTCSEAATCLERISTRDPRESSRVLSSLIWKVLIVVLPPSLCVWFFLFCCFFCSGSFPLRAILVSHSSLSCPTQQYSAFPGGLAQCQGSLLCILAHLRRFSGPPKWNGAISNVISYTWQVQPSAGRKIYISGCGHFHFELRDGC